jgi:predicted nucleic acid-binding protein
VVYLDTSVVVSLLTPETTSEAALQWILKSNQPIVSCDWIRTEFASALAIKFRLGQLNTKTLKATQAEFDHLIDSGVRLAPVTREMFIRAAQLAGQPKNSLRAGDSLHLAAALMLGANAMATFDSHLMANAKKAGLKTINF